MVPFVLVRSEWEDEVPDLATKGMEDEEEGHEREILSEGTVLHVGVVLCRVSGPIVRYWQARAPAPGAKEVSKASLQSGDQEPILSLVPFGTCTIAGVMLDEVISINAKARAR